MIEEEIITNSSNEEERGPVIPTEEKPVTGPQRRGNQFVKSDDPKSEQFTGRATVKEAERIKVAISARKQGQYDIVRLCLDMLDHIEADILKTFKTK